ncbi:MAG: hypothetical protein MI723_10140 [Caulobacterales bacterium]|nr:hypothetical protein [Caulobacterales bacterium]
MRTPSAFFAPCSRRRGSLGAALSAAALATSCSTVGGGSGAPAPLSYRMSDAGVESEEAELSFSLVEGRVRNAFLRDGPIAAHVVMTSGHRPRLVVAFPAGNSGVGLWFEEEASPVDWSAPDRVRGVRASTAEGDALYGVSVEVEVDAPRLAVRKAVTGSARTLRGYQYVGSVPSIIDAPLSVDGATASWSRRRLDGEGGYAVAVDVLAGSLRESGASAVLLAPENGPLRLRVTALTGDAPLTPIDQDALFSAAAGDDVKARNVLAFLSYREKFLAGSWRFNTYFGRDTLMSARLLMPALSPEAIEAAFGSVIERLDAAGEVAHEEDIGEFAILRRMEDGGAASIEPVFDYKMVDDDFMLAPVVARYLLDHPRGPARAAAFLERRTGAGDAYGEALARNFRFVAQAAGPFADNPSTDGLVALREGEQVGEWRDSLEGLGDGRIAYNVNAVFVPAALHAIARLVDSGLLEPYRQGDDGLAAAGDMAAVWAREAEPFFAVATPAAEARAKVGAYARASGVDPAPALASLPEGAVSFNAVSLDADTRPIPVLHSDDGFALLFLDPEPARVERSAAALMRPFPAGLMTDVGLVVANAAYAEPETQADFTNGHYHGAVMWSWQHAVLAAGLERQLARADLPETTRQTLEDARRRLWAAILSTRDVRTSELWSWSFGEEGYQVEPFGQRVSDVTESNAAQLWSTVFLALPEP